MILAGPSAKSPLVYYHSGMAKKKNPVKPRRLYSCNNTGTPGVTFYSKERWSRTRGYINGPYWQEGYRASWREDGKYRCRDFLITKTRTEEQAFLLAVKARQKGIQK